MTKLITILLVCISLLVRSQTTYFITSKDSTRLYVQEFGSGDPVVILAGGPGLNAIYMEDVWKKLSSKYRCIVLDQRGTGKSIVAKVDSVSMSMSNYVNDLEALRHHLGVEKITLVGHSWGGMLIMEYTARHPLRVKKIIFLDPGGPTSKFFQYFGDNMDVRLHDEDRKEADRLDSLKQSSLKAIWPGYFFDRKRALATQSRVGPEVHGQKGVNGPTVKSYLTSQEERVKRMKNYGGPVYLIQGRQDPIGESTAYEIKAALPQTEIHFVEKAGHFPWLENDAQVKEFYGTIFKWLADSSHSR